MQGLWTPDPGAWQGKIVWGDNHSASAESHRGLPTKYLEVATTNDNLFVDGPTPGATESATPGYNAMMVWN